MGTSDGAGDLDRLIADVAAAIPAIVDTTLDRVASEVPTLAVVETDDLRATTTEMLTLLVTALQARRVPTDEEADAVAGVAATMRARQGVPVDAVLHRYRLMTGELWRRLTDGARAGHVGTGPLVELAQLAWDGADVLMVHAARAHRLAELDMERQNEEERRSFLRALLLGSIQPQDLRQRAAAFGLSLDAPYVPFRARALGGLSMHRLEEAVLGAGTGGDQAGLTCLLEGTLLGVLPEVPTIDGLPGAVGVGPAVPLEAAKSSFQLANRALETAVSFDLEGVFRVEDLPLRALVASEPHLGDALVDTYLRPLDALGQFGPAVQTTLREFFARGMRVEETARALEVHPNTLRHRLRRFEEVTGTDLGSTEELFRIWWALERRDLLRRLDPTAGAAPTKRRGAASG